jgi:hypothetical protein
MNRPGGRTGLLLIALGLGQGCSKRASDASLGPDMKAICLATETPDAGADKWTRFGDIVPVFRGGTIYVLEGRAPDAEVAIGYFGLRQTATIACPPSRVLLWLPGVTQGTEDAGRQDPIGGALAGRGLRVNEVVEFGVGEGNRWRERICHDADACCRLLRLTCRFDAKTEAEMRECMRVAKRIPKPHVDSSCE